MGLPDEQKTPSDQNSSPKKWPEDPLCLPPDLEEKARKELGETPEVRTKAIAELKERLQALPENEKPHRMDDQYLLAFLRPQHFDVQVAFRKITQYATYKRQHQGLLQGMRAEQFRKFLRLGFIRPLAPADQEGRHLIYVCPPKLLELENPEDAMRFQIFYFEQTGVLFDPYAQVHGMVVVDQLQGFSATKAMRLFHGPIKHVPRNVIFFVREALPFRVKAILMINEPSYMDLIFGILRPLMSPLLLSRVKLLGRGEKGNAALQELVRPEFLTPELGGTWGQTTDEWVDQVTKMEAGGQIFPVI